MVCAGRAIHAVLTVLVASVVLAGCGKEPKPTGPTPVPPPSQIQLTGVFVGPAENGLLDLTIDAASLAPPSPADTTVTATGVMSLDGGGVVNVTGTYDTAADSLHVSGQGYTLAGRYIEGGAPARLQGSYSGPSGGGAFGALPGARPSAIHVFCATYENSEATLWGTLDFAASATSIVGFEVPDGGTAVMSFQGTVAGIGNPKAIAFAGSSFTGNGSWNLLTGHVEGVWASPLGSGVWSGDPCIPGTTGSE